MAPWGAPARACSSCRRRWVTSSSNLWGTTVSGCAAGATASLEVTYFCLSAMWVCSIA